MRHWMNIHHISTNELLLELISAYVQFEKKYHSDFLIFKVAGVINLKLAFTEWFLVILITLYKIRYLNSDKALLYPRIQVICLKNWKLWRASTTINFNIFGWNFAPVSYLTMSTKGCLGFFSFCLDFCFAWVINSNVKNECVATRSYLFSQITQDLNKIKKIPNTLFSNIGR